MRIAALILTCTRFRCRERGIDLYLKDESVHPTGSLKHRLGAVAGALRPVQQLDQRGTTLVEASSGSTAVSEAYFARLLNLPFVAVMPASTVREKCELIEFYGGQCKLVEDPTTIYQVAADLADQLRRVLPRPVHLRRTGHLTGAITTLPSRCLLS